MMARDWRSSNFHHSCSLLVLTVVLVVCSRAQDTTPGELNVDITLSSRNRTTAIVPSRVDTVYIIGSENINVTNSSSPSNITTYTTCVGTNCTVRLVDMLLTSDSVLTINFTNAHVLILTVRDNLDSSCREYNVPQEFSSSVDQYVFTCEPFETFENATEVAWRKFSSLEEVMLFQRMPSSGREEMIMPSDIFNLTNVGNIKNAQLTVTRTSEPEEVVFYYVPSFMVNEEPRQRPTAETAIFLGPTIRDPPREFSLELVFNSTSAMNYTMIQCVGTSFPPASTSWELTNPEFPAGQNLVLFNGFNSSIFLLDAVSTSNHTMVSDAIVQLIDPAYEEDGVFTCTVDNGFSSISQSVRLRVKSPLRPLWPSLGVIGVVILVSLFMLGGFTVEKIREKKKMHKFVEGSSNHTDGQRLSSVSSSSGGQANSRGGKKHSAVKRVSSNKPLIDESTL